MIHVKLQSNRMIFDRIVAIFLKKLLPNGVTIIANYCIYVIPLTHLVLGLDELDDVGVHAALARRRRRHLERDSEDSGRQISGK